MLDRIYKPYEEEAMDDEAIKEIQAIIDAYEQAKMMKINKREFIEMYSKESRNEIQN
jgi:23S rRNA maturation-related 3'-5' exoribonuclease YhaM|tara:strand:+ start:417 stop:587 length:171 start_codon:yes stop_codon:yes gene_type:complete